MLKVHGKKAGMSTGTPSPALTPGFVDGKVLGGIYFALSAFAVLQLIRTCLSTTRRVWSLQSAFLALCLAWTSMRAIYFMLVFQRSESCAGFTCIGGTYNGMECNAGRTHPAIAGECSGGACISNSPLSCAGQHVLFGLPTMIQSFMLSTLIVFYSYWVHKANASVRPGDGRKIYRCLSPSTPLKSVYCPSKVELANSDCSRDQQAKAQAKAQANPVTDHNWAIVYRRRVLILCGLVNTVYYVCFGIWIFGMRCSESAALWVQCGVCKEVRLGAPNPIIPPWGILRESLVVGIGVGHPYICLDRCEIVIGSHAGI